MSVFKPVSFSWHGKQHTIAPTRVLGAIAVVENTLTLYELMQYSQRGTAPLGKLAQAYGALLRYAGAQVSDDDIYAGMFSSTDDQSAVSDALTTLLAMMIPPALSTGDASAARGNAPSAAARGSPNTTKRASAKVG